MNKNKDLIYKILGIGGSCLLIVSVFLPFLNYEGLTINLFESASEQSYIPYIIIAASVISIVLILLNKKIELAYMMVGSLLTVSIYYSVLYKDSFEFLSFGYYLLILGTLILLVSLLIQPKKGIEIVGYNTNTKEKSDNKPVINSITNSESNINNQPNGLAQSIMDQPVMRMPSSENSDVQSNSIPDNSNSVNNTNNTNIETGSSVSLAPQNPLNQFISGNVDPNQIRVETNNSDLLQSSLNSPTNSDNNVEQKEDIKTDNTQSILSIMNQPMVSSYQNNTNGGPINAQPLSSMSDEQSTNGVAESQTVSSPIPDVQPVGGVVEPTVQVPPIPEIQPTSGVVESNENSVFNQSPIKFE